MYQQSPRAEGGAEWPESYFGPGIWFNEWPADMRLRTIAWDPSKGKGSKWGDYSAVVAVGLSGSTLYVDAKMRNDQPIDQMVSVAVELHRTFKADAFGVESNQFQELLGGQLLQEARAVGVPFSPYLIDNRVNKEVRIRRLNPWLANGQIRFKGGSPGARLLVEQLKDFPNADHDDGPDALEMALRLMAELGTVVDDGLGQNLFTRG
jgi:predicted phage terminase large subunit-like protein